MPEGLNFGGRRDRVKLKNRSVPFSGYRHIEGVSVKAEFSPDRKYRYRLEITKAGVGAAGRMACVIMQNPSYANEEIADRSVQFMERIVLTSRLPQFPGEGKVTVVNLYAYIQTKDFVPAPEKIGPRNDQAIEDAIRESEIVILAWGSSKSLLERELFVMALLDKYPGKRLFKTKSHPSRGRYEGFIMPFHR